MPRFHGRPVSNFAITTTRGLPTKTTLSALGLPPGVLLVDHGDGTATLTGTPPPTAVYLATITADNGSPSRQC